jgi:photosystem II stability/assembly factor-like uncharacterized protein
MKNFLILLGFALITQAGQAQQQFQDTSGTAFKQTLGDSAWHRVNMGATKSVNTVSFVGPDTGYIGGGEGIFRTTDHGATWHIWAAAPIAPVVRFYDRLFGSINGFNSLYSRTTDGGGIWTTGDTKIEGGNYALTFWNPKYGYACGDQRVSATTDSGKTWTPHIGDTKTGSGALRSIVAFDSLTALAVGDNYFWPAYPALGSTASMLYTSDGGISWSRLRDLTIRRHLYATCLLSASAVAVGGDGFFALSSDRGSSWTAIDSSLDIGVTAICFTDSEHGIMVGYSGKIVKTTDAGKTWLSQNSGTKMDLSGVTFSDGNNGWIVGDGLVVLHTTNGGTDWVSIQPTSIPLQVATFPEPFASTTTINYTLPQSQRITLTVYDLSGRVVRNLLNSIPQTAGQHSVMFDGSMLPAGIYTYQLTSEQYAATGRVTLIK